YTVLGSCTSESSWRIELRNHKDEDVSVDLVEPVGGDWEVVSSSLPYTRLDAATFTMTAEVPARGSVTVEYRVRTRWC
ncbi:MAG TPA: hypothetical protein VFQ22_13950, partial [Longimicrobiales bacterium]|nr:hypothetical protein [Longimicrobiales bacterium]